MSTAVRKLDSSTTVIIHRKTENPLQLQLFQESGYRKRWYTETIEVAKTFRCPFWPSELRGRCLIAPDSAAMWGTLFRMLPKAGFRQTGEYRKSLAKGRRGGIEFQWVDGRNL